MRGLLSTLGELFWQERTPQDETHAHGETQLFESGDTLINRVVDAIRLRRSVLITGPRGSGKSFCAEKGIERASDQELIGGYHFLQGNREIPRDYLSEDMLVIRENAADHRPTPKLVDALVVRPPQLDVETLRALRQQYGEHFPGVLKADRDGVSSYWTNAHWTVLFLDEINRFGDGFLDSLLSLTEERTIVRGGIKLYVPIIVVATANPPGYDVTAKKLSPPLQARISRSYRVSQPALPAMVYRVLPDQLKRYRAEYGGRSIDIDQELRKRVAGAALCLWGNPDPARKGVGFLTQHTRDLLAEVCQHPEFASLLRAFGDLVSFGPDARSVGDWVGCALGIASRRPGGPIKITIDDLQECALEVLAHKVRENFNEGTDPTKVATKERLISEIVRFALNHPSLGRLFETPYEAAINTLLGIDPKVYVDTYTSDDKPRAELALATIDRLSATCHRKFVIALATGAPQESPDRMLDPTVCSVAQLHLLRDVVRNAHDRECKSERARVESLFKEMSSRRCKLVDTTRRVLSIHPELRRWREPIEATARAYRSRDITLGACADWLLALGIVAESLAQAPTSTGEPNRVSPMLADVFAQVRDRNAGVRLGNTGKDHLNDRWKHAFSLVAPARHASTLLADTGKRLAIEVAIESRKYLDDVLDVLGELAR